MKSIWIEVFRAGTNTDASGDTREWTQADLDTIVSKYNDQSPEERHDAPVVIGHPVTDSPAYGWVLSLKRDGTSLWAELDKDALDPQFVDWVERGLYKKRSIALYEDLRLKHIGFLGGVPPAIKGLADPQFQDNGGAVYSYEFEEATTEQKQEPDQVSIFQNARSTKYGIKAKEVGSKIKPERYADLNDEQFADPVNYRFPLSKQYIQSALATWNRSTVQSQYDENESKVILSRLMQAAKGHNVRLDEYKWAYIEVAAEDLSRKQLIDHINKTSQKDNHPQGSNNGSQTNYEETSMDAESLDKMMSDLLAFLSETFGEEVANQVSAKIDELKTTYLQPADGEGEGTPAAAPGMQANEDDKKAMRAMQQRINQLETKDRINGFKEYVNKLVTVDNKLVPAQIDTAVAALELSYGVGSKEFSEDGKTVKRQGVEIIKSLLESFPKLDLTTPSPNGVAFSEQPAEGFEGMVVDEEAAQLDKKIRAYQESQAKVGKTVMYLDAFRAVTAQGAV